MYVLYSRNTWREKGLWGLRRGRQKVTKGHGQKERAILVMIHTACDRDEWLRFKTWYTNCRFLVWQWFWWLRLIIKISIHRDFSCNSSYKYGWKLRYLLSHTHTQWPWESLDRIYEGLVGQPAWGTMAKSWRYPKTGSRTSFGTLFGCQG
jgi:hypothetical protein